MFARLPIYSSTTYCRDACNRCSIERGLFIMGSVKLYNGQKPVISYGRHLAYYAEKHVSIE